MPLVFPLDQRPLHSDNVKNQFPAFYHDDAQTFMLFVKAYYEYMEQEGKTQYELNRVEGYKDIDLTLESYIDYFRKTVLPSIPIDVLADKRLLVKTIRDFYQSKGTIDSYRFLFRALYKEDIEVNYPSDKMLIVSEGDFRLDRYLVISSDEQAYKFIGRTIQGLENFRAAMFSDDINLAAFNVAIKNGDKDAKDALAKANNLLLGKDLKVIRQKATQIFNEVKTKQVCDSVYGVGSDSTIDTVEEAVDVIELLEEEGVLSKADAKIAIKGIKNGNHGFYINGKPYTVVENAAKDERFENATHERGHKMLADAILSKEGRAKLRSIAKVILEFAQKNDPVLYTRLVAEVSPYLNKQVSADNASDYVDNISDENIDEPIVVFLEKFDIS